MALDLDAFPPAVKLQQIKLGEEFGSRDTLDQANQTLNAHGKYGAKLAGHGFQAPDAQRLTDARDLLIAAGVGRDAAKGEKKTTSAAYTSAMTRGQTARLSARSILEAVKGDLEELGQDAPAKPVDVVLKQTSLAGEHAEALATQLDLLRAKLQDPTLATYVTARSGNDAAQKATDAAAALRAADQADTGARGTPAETERLDQLDGIIVRLVRRARNAAVAAGRALGEPSLAEEFKLDKLYQSRGGKPAAEEPPGGSAAPAAPVGEGQPEVK